MKVIKPQRLSLLQKVFEEDGEAYLAITVLAYFSLGTDPHLLPEIDMWRVIPVELGREAVLDMGMPKPRGEVLVTGRAYPPGRPQPVCAVRLRLASVDKTLWVVGDRYWQRDAATDPIPFEEMPITWARAFGGNGYAKNPLGKGYGPVAGEVAKTRPLPNIEDPRHLVGFPEDRPEPAGFGAYDLCWPQRFSKVGTYDHKWLKTRFPGMAADMDLEAFNTAPEDMRIQGFWNGDEAFTLDNLHPERPVLEGALPRIVTRAFINQKTPEGVIFRQVSMHLETVHLFPHIERGVLLFRGLTPVQEDDAADVLHLMLAAEGMSAPKPEQHYRDVLAQRLDPDKGYLYGLRERDLLPEPKPGEPARDKTETEVLLQEDGLREKSLKAKAESAKASGAQQVNEELTKLGLDPRTFLGPADVPDELVDLANEPLPDEDHFAEFVEKIEARLETERANVDKRRAQGEADARARFVEAGFDYDEGLAELEKCGGGPPRFSAKAERRRLEELAEFLSNAGFPNPDLEIAISDPEFDRRLQLMEDQARDGYRQSAHYAPAARRLEGQGRTDLRDEILAAHRGGQALVGRDFTGADLSGLDLRSLDLTEVFLENANLSGTDLRGAKLERAVLARADLSNANLGNAKLEDANLGLAKLAQANVAGADLSGAVLYKADLTLALFQGADLSGADLTEALVRGADFSAATMQLVTFLRTDLRGVKFCGTDLFRVNVIECDVGDVDFSGARLASATFLATRGVGATFCGANLENVRMVKETVFDRADFTGATLTGGNLRGTSLVGAVFFEAEMTGADLSDCNLTDANLEGIVGRGAMLVRTELTRANLQDADLMVSLMGKAKVAGADLRRANLFRADLAKMAGDDRTRLSGANLKNARIIERRSRGQG